MPGRLIPHIETQRLALGDAETRKAYRDGVTADLQSGDTESARMVLLTYIEALGLHEPTSASLLMPASDFVLALRTQGGLSNEQMLCVIEYLNRLEHEQEQRLHEIEHRAAA